MDDNTFECPNCGARIYPEMTRCPQCGQNMYPEDEATLPGEGEQAGWLSLLGAVVIGWMIASGIAMLVHFIVARFASPTMLGPGGRVILFLAAPVGAFVGAYVCGGLGKWRTWILGGLVGILSLLVSILLSSHWVKVTASWLLSPWILAAGGLTILAGAGGGWLNDRLTRNTAWQERWKVRGWEDLLYQELLRRTRFNGSIADRLIEYERKQDPQANRLKLIQNAIERWERDNR